MNDFDALLRAVLAQARSSGIPVSSAIDPHVVVNTRALTRFGCCVRRGGSFQIQLTHRLLDAPEQSCRETLAHEVLHTCPGCQNHGQRWRAYAGRMNAAFGYHISRTSRPEDLGVADLRPVRHLVVCQKCGREFPRTKASNLTLHPERYRCKCGGTLVLKY
ncbi:SprT-like domain-containing protein [Pseudoflavonifractor sp. HCP28S3_F10]|uniref:SprT-like domain-containing protein n=1 Tax=Pseudoflavonifractor sp. HCP28S3_F10 TaxID=3438947 RepID=UPI003F892372